MDKEDFEIIKHFGPSILKTRIPDKMINQINKYVDKTIIDKKKSKELDNGDALVADVTQEIRLEKEIMDEIGWLKFLVERIGKWIDIETKQRITEMKMVTTWVVRQFENEFNPTHWHEGHISGAGFLKIPKNLGKFTQNKPSNTYQGGNLNLVHGQRSFLSRSTYHIFPKVGDLYLFPNYLMHHVYPFKNTNEERRSISFNLKINESIYNVYKR